MKLLLGAGVDETCTTYLWGSRNGRDLAQLQEKNIGALKKRGFLVVVGKGGKAMGKSRNEAETKKRPCAGGAYKRRYNNAQEGSVEEQVQQKGPVGKKGRRGKKIETQRRRKGKRRPS